VDAVLLAFLPGPLAGQAVVDILTGRVNPSARLPITYPKFEDGGGIPYMHAVSDMCTKDTNEPLPHWEYQDCEVQWPFGHGLSYTSFEYSDMALNTNELQYRRRRPSEDPVVLQVSVNVHNSGDRAGADTVLLFTFDEFRSTTPEQKRLRAFEKIWLEPGDTKAVQFTIPLDDLRFVGPHDETHYIFQNGMTFRVGVGAGPDCRRHPDIPACSAPVTITTDDDYVGACEAACHVWAESGCSHYHHMTMDKCWDLCGSIHQDPSNELQMNNDGW
jgi:beta-glucosidase